MDFLRIPKEDLLAYEFHASKVFHPSYYVALDRATNSIVLAIRGTMVIERKQTIRMFTRSTKDSMEFLGTNMYYSCPM